MSSDFKSYYELLKRFPFTQLPWQTPATAILPKGFTNVCIVGIGGSSVGTKAVCEALNVRNVFFLDTIDPSFVAATLAHIPFKRTLFYFVSKSGSTLEILTLAALLAPRIPSSHHARVITDAPYTRLGRFASKRGYEIIISPESIPGRFSLFSSVCCAPLSSLGVSVPNLLAGARTVSAPKAYALARTLYEAYSNGKTIPTAFIYCELLRGFGDWYVQLVSESLGKTRAIGPTAHVAIGVKDQHSQLQLFLDGPRDKFFIFIKPARFPNEEATRLKSLFEAQYRGVVAAFKKKKLHFAEVGLDDISESSLGNLFYFFELVVGFLGLLFDIDFQSQPAVELSKTITRKLLNTYPKGIEQE